MESMKQDLALEMQGRRGQPYEEAELLLILLQVTAGLLHAKSQDIAHQDIKPHNILRDENRLNVVDFGSAWQKGAYSLTSSAAGTEAYLSPEGSESLAEPSGRFSRTCFRWE